MPFFLFTVAVYLDISDHGLELVFSGNRTDERHLGEKWGLANAMCHDWLSYHAAKVQQKNGICKQKWKKKKKNLVVRKKSSIFADET